MTDDYSLKKMMADLKEFQRLGLDQDDHQVAEIVFEGSAIGEVDIADPESVMQICMRHPNAGNYLEVKTDSASKLMVRMRFDRIIARYKQIKSKKEGK